MSPDASQDYRAKARREADLLSKYLASTRYPAPLGDPSSGVMLLVEGPVGPRATHAIGRSLETIGLPSAYVTWTGTDLLMQNLLCAEPGALVALGPAAARELDDLAYPLARRSFADAAEGDWFPWTSGTAGLRLPSIVPALSDEAAKRRFWSLFLLLRDVA